MEIPGILVLDEVVGSRAYGLATEDSDTDRLGVFVAPTNQIAGLGWSRRNEVVVGKTEEGDFCYRELGATLRLWLSCNPTVTELLWMPTVSESHGYPGSRFSGDTWESRRGPWSPAMVKGIIPFDLLSLRPLFLSTNAVSNAYGGYARQQAMKLDKRHDSFSSETKNRTAKHARHCMRLLLQGEQLLTTGELTVDCSKDRDFLFEMGELAQNNVDKFMLYWGTADDHFKVSAQNSVLPKRADKDAVNEFLIYVRKACWE